MAEYPNTVTRSSRQRSAGNRASRPRQPGASNGQVRIIGGRWRGRKLAVPDVDGLRPTGDRVRETLFNWLQMHVAGARCLDLFAGSGALGLEALSRHASSLTMVENSSIALKHLKQSCQLLGVDTSELLPGTVNQTDAQGALAYLHEGAAQSALNLWTQAHQAPVFDIVFIDPPFASASQWSVLQALVPKLLADQAWVYVEAPRELAVPENLPKGCEIAKEKVMGEVVIRLVSYCKIA